MQASAQRLLQQRRGHGHAVWASRRVERHTDAGRAFVHTWLVETFLLAADAATVEGLVAGPGVWDAEARPAPDGTYPDMASGREVAVRGV